MMDKNTLVSILKSSGLKEESLHNLHVELERRAPHVNYLINLIMFVGICFLGMGTAQSFIIKTVVPYMLALMLIGVSVACAAV